MDRRYRLSCGFPSTMLLACFCLYRHELPAVQVAPLRGQLLEHIVAYASGPRMVLTRLCVAVRVFMFLQCRSRYLTFKLLFLLRVHQASDLQGSCYLWLDIFVRACSANCKYGNSESQMTRFSDN